MPPSPAARTPGAPPLETAGAELLAALAEGLGAGPSGSDGDPAERLAGLLGQVARSFGHCQLTFPGQDVYLNDQRLPGTSERLARHAPLLRYLEAAGVVRLEATGRVGSGDVRRALHVIQGPAQTAGRVEAGELALELVRGRTPAGPEPLLERNELGLRTYAHALVFLQDLGEQLKRGGAPPVRRGWRLVQDLVDLARADVAPLLALACLRDRRDVFHHHSVNVCLLSIALGQRLGLRKQPLASLGMAALLHDLGKLALPARLLHKAEALTDEERGLLERIPLETVRLLLRHESLCVQHPEQLVLAYEHARQQVPGERARAPAGGELARQAQVLAIANLYDALTTERAHRGAYLPDEALRYLGTLAGERFEPALVHAFGQLVGRWPLGTLARLDDGALAVVVEVPAGGGDRPRVRVVVDAAGVRVDGEWLDLAAADEPRRIVGAVHPSEHRVNVLRYLLG